MITLNVKTAAHRLRIQNQNPAQSAPANSNLTVAAINFFIVLAFTK